MIKNRKMTPYYDTGTWWLPGSPPNRYQTEATPHFLSRPIIESVASDKKKARKTSEEDSNGSMENKINSNNKILTSVNNRMKSETEGTENKNKELKPNLEGKIKLKSVGENVKTVVGRNSKDFIPTDHDLNPSQKAKKNVQNPKVNRYKEIASLFSIPTHNRFQILENPTLQTEDSNNKSEMASLSNDRIRDLDYENRKDRETVNTNIFFIILNYRKN